MLESKKGFSLLAVKLQTGRSHQIRVQLSSMGHPIYGDQKYGQHLSKVGQQIALWAYTLSFEHPVRKEPVNVKSIPPRIPLGFMEDIKKLASAPYSGRVP